MTKDNLAILISPCIAWNESTDILNEIVKSKLSVKTC